MNLSSLLATLLATSPASSAPPVEEHWCSVMYTAEGETHIESIPGLRVLDYTADHELMELVVEGGEVNGIICSRTSIVPQPNDYQVLLAGYVFSIRSSGRHAVIERRSGEYTFRPLPGTTLTSEEQLAAEQQLAKYPLVRPGDAAN